MRRWRIPLHRHSLGTEEVRAVVKVMKSGRLTMGNMVRKFEQAWERRLGQHCVMVNSGSSANLLMWSVLTSPLRVPRLLPGEEVIVPALCWSTTVWPIIQHGLVPVFVDIEPLKSWKYGLTLNTVATAVVLKQDSIKAMCPVNVYGESPNMEVFSHSGKILTEDACEGIASTGKAELSTLSFYLSHHMTTAGEGGLLVCRRETDAELARIIRAHGWLRNVGKSVGVSLPHSGGPVSWLDQRFTFVHAGYNLRPTEISAAVGLEQLKKFDRMNTARRRAAHLITGETYTYPPFGVIVICLSERHRMKVVSRLHRKGIETRPLLVGNMPEQPAMQLYKHRVESDGEARQVARCGIGLGCAGLTDSEARWMGKQLKEALK